MWRKRPGLQKAVRRKKGDGAGEAEEKPEVKLAQSSLWPQASSAWFQGATSGLEQQGRGEEAEKEEEEVQRTMRGGVGEGGRGAPSTSAGGEPEPPLASPAGPGQGVPA